MFYFLKKQDRFTVYSPIKGKCIDIADVNDIAFSSKSMGDGVAIIPTDSIIYAPCDGSIIMAFKTGHAIGIKSKIGVEILIHIGIDTVNLNGKGFYLNVCPGDKIKKGDILIRFDLEEIKKMYDTSVIVMITNRKKLNKCNLYENVDNQTSIVELDNNV